MENSVNNNKGFYVGRYEASQLNDTTAQSKRNQVVWINVPQTSAIVASNNMKSSVNSHLIYAVEWDSILNWLKGNAMIASLTNNQIQAMKLEDIQTDCRTWGNYSNSLGDAATGSNKLQTTGTSEYWKANNIYDLAGNAWEWTQEIFSSDILGWRTLRGGSCNYNGNEKVLAIRNYQGEGYKNIDVRISYMFIFVIIK